MNMYRVINNVKRRRRFRGEERDRDALLRTRRALPRAIRRQYPEIERQSSDQRPALISAVRGSPLSPHLRTHRAGAREPPPKPPIAGPGGGANPPPPTCVWPPVGMPPSGMPPSARHPSACRPSTCRPSARHPSGPSPSSRSGASRNLPAASRFAAARAARLPSSPPARRNPGPAACAAWPPIGALGGGAAYSRSRSICGGIAPPLRAEPAAAAHRLTAAPPPVRPG